MKAWVLHKPGDIRYEDVAVPEPAPGWVRVKVMAAGICGSDVPRVFETGAHNMPLIPGHEFSGVVDGGDAALAGKRVGVFPLIPCRECGPCKAGLYEMCRNYNYLGSRCDGAFAEYVNVPVRNLIELPDDVSFEVAAMLEPMAVAVHAMRKGIGGVAKDAPVAVCGLGPIGRMLAAFLTDAGYKNLWLIGNKESQRKCADALGLSAERFINSRECNAAERLKELTGGAALIFECVGKNDCVSMCIEAAAPAGCVVTVGNPASDISFDKKVYWKILRDQLTVRGTWNSGFTGDADDDWHYVIERLCKGMDASAFISHRLSTEELMGGLEMMRDKTEEYCKVMIVRGE